MVLLERAKLDGNHDHYDGPARGLLKAGRDSHNWIIWLLLTARSSKQAGAINENYGQLKPRTACAHAIVVIQSVSILFV